MIRNDYIKFRADAENDDKSNSYFCSTYKYDLEELKHLLHADISVKKEILKARRQQYAQRMNAIDEALFKAAESGDTKAADLLYRRFDGWNPKIVEETHNYYNFAEIVKGIHNKAKIVKRPM